MAVVYLSPSVQSWNVGYGNYGTEEQRMNLIADVVQYDLERHGVQVVRNNPEQSLREIVAESNAVGPDAHVAIHSNASNGNARGAEIYVHRFGGASERLARDIYQYLSAVTPVDDLGVKEGWSAFNGQGYYELRRTNGPAVLIEVSFHDNPEDAQFIIDHIVELGLAISKGTLEYLGIPYQQDTQENINYLRSLYNGKEVM